MSSTWTEYLAFGVMHKPTKTAIRVGQYNVLCPAYGVKWGEREACLDWHSETSHGASNWSIRWPALLRVIGSAKWDILALEEIEDSVRDDVTTGTKELGLNLVWFDHPARLDALGLCYSPEVFSVRGISSRGAKATVGRVDLLHKISAMTVSVLVTHQRGHCASQLAELCDFADDQPVHDITIICGDFNEDFGRDAGTRLTRDPSSPFTTLPRDPSTEPTYSRPNHKMEPGQSSGKGKIDYIFARSNRKHISLHLQRDDASQRSLLMSHAPCRETGAWPSDHGLEALTVHIKS